MAMPSLSSAYDQWLSVEVSLHLLYEGKLLGPRLDGNTQVSGRHRQSKICRQQAAQTIDVKLGDVFQVVLHGFDLGRWGDRKHVGLGRHFLVNWRIWGDDDGL